MTYRLCAAFVVLGAWIVGAEPQPGTDGSAVLPPLPRVSDLPASYRPIGTLGGRGSFYAAGTPLHRVDDGDAHHGMPATVAWAASLKDEDAQRQGLIYGIDNGRVTTAGYLIRHADLVAGRSFHGLTLREFDFPAARFLTIHLVDAGTQESDQYLWLWHFVPRPNRVRPLLRSGELQLVTRLPPTFTIVRNESYPADFYPRMGRHRRDSSTPASRLPATTGSHSVWYGEAAGKLIFIEYVFNQRDFADGASWSDLLLDGVPIPPIDNVHILHYNGARPEAPGRYTAHMYFLPEREYLSWEREPRVLESGGRQR